MLIIKWCHIKSKDNQEQSSMSIFSIEPLNGKIRYIKVDTTRDECSLSNAHDGCVNKPLNFQRILRRVLNDIIFCDQIDKFQLTYARYVV